MKRKKSQHVIHLQFVLTKVFRPMVVMFVTRCIWRRGTTTAVLFEHLCHVLLEWLCVCTKARMDVFVSCVAQALLLCRVVQRRSTFRNKGLHQALRRRRWWRQSPISYGEERRRSVLCQVKRRRRVMPLISRQPFRRTSRVGDNAF